MDHFNFSSQSERGINLKQSLASTSNELRNSEYGSNDYLSARIKLDNLGNTARERGSDTVMGKINQMKCY